MLQGAFMEERGAWCRVGWPALPLVALWEEGACGMSGQPHAPAWDGCLSLQAAFLPRKT